MRDVRYAIRLLLRHPRYTVLAVVTLAAGIGANGAMFALLDAVYFRPLPIADQDRLVNVTLVSPGSRFAFLSYEEFLDVERSVPAFRDVMAIGPRGVTLNRDGEVHQLLIHYVSGRYFPSLAIPMHLGRGFGPADDSESVAPQVVINHHLWKERLGAPPDIIGRQIQLNSTMFTVVGVTAPGFAGLNRIVRTDVWVTAAQAPFVVPGLRDEVRDRRRRWFSVVGRLADGADVDRARAELDVLMSRWRADGGPAYQEARFVVQGQREEIEAETKQGAAFLALVGLVLLIACANVANLTLARGEGRRQEMSLRTALGATRMELVRQMTIESAIVTMAGTAVGLLAASWLIRLVPSLLPPGAFMMVLDARLDSRLLGFTALLASAATLLVGIVPAWRGTRGDITSGLKARTPAGGRGGLQLRDALVVGEIALSAIVIIAAGLLVRSFMHSLAVQPGFAAGKEVATFYVVPGLKGYDQAGTYRFLEECRRAATALPGVARASFGIRLPAQGNEAGWAAAVNVPGHEPPPNRSAFSIRYTMVGPGYFEVMGTRILSGRGVAEGDRPDSAPIAIVSETMARTFWPGASPLGQRIDIGSPPVVREIVGVAEDIRIGGLHEPPEMYVYVPYAQDPQSFGLLLVEAEGEIASIVGAVRQRIAGIDPSIPVLDVSSFHDHMSRLLYEDRRNAWLAIGMAVLALTLGAVGVHGVVSLVTVRRTKEIGIRVALGASRRQLLRLLMGKGVRLALIGGALGVGGGLFAGRQLSDLLHGIGSSDLWSFALGTIVCLVVALGASFAPVWRAARLDPASALREE
jgi:predicted permease